jgi:DNA-binding CsgD family transcriptional regulator
MLLLITLMASLDVASDIKHSVAWAHVLLEASMIFASILAVVLSTYWFYEVTESSWKEAKNKYKLSEAECKYWRDENKHLIQGLAEKILIQFNSWRLTKAEIEVGFLILKGFSFSEISDLRNGSTRTVREQASNIYHKAGMHGRAEFTAYFLEDLLPANTANSN